MKFAPTLIATLLAGMGMASQATEFRSADTHNADDYPTVAAVKYMSTLLEQKSGGKHKIKVFFLRLSDGGQPGL
jgi:TRAP-type C4-dicarboxylate transport system substrate-binding protein